jgi:hypothetical protein
MQTHECCIAGWRYNTSPDGRCQIARSLRTAKTSVRARGWAEAASAIDCTVGVAARFHG